MTDGQLTTEAFMNTMRLLMDWLHQLTIPSRHGFALSARDPAPEPLEDRCLLAVGGLFAPLSKPFWSETFQVRWLEVDPFQITLSRNNLPRGGRASGAPAAQSALWELLSPAEATPEDRTVGRNSSPPAVVVDHNDAISDQSPFHRNALSAAGTGADLTTVIPRVENATASLTETLQDTGSFPTTAATALQALPARRLSSEATRVAASPAATPSAHAETARVPGHLIWAELGVLAAQAFYLGSLRAPADLESSPAGTATDLPDQTRLIIADLLRGSTEAFSRLVRSFFQNFLGRPPAAGEEVGWVELLMRGQTEETVLAVFLSTEEFGDRATLLAPAATPDESYVQALHALLLQRQATSAELATWLTALAAVGRAGVASVLVASTEYRRLRIAALFEEWIGQPGEPAAITAWATTPFPLLVIRQHLIARSDADEPSA
jgi:hypothetical protein